LGRSRASSGSTQGEPSAKLEMIIGGAPFGVGRGLTTCTGMGARGQGLLSRSRDGLWSPGLRAVTPSSELRLYRGPVRASAEAPTYRAARSSRGKSPRASRYTRGGDEGVRPVGGTLLVRQSTRPQQPFPEAGGAPGVVFWVRVGRCASRKSSTAPEGRFWSPGSPPVMVELRGSCLGVVASETPWGTLSGAKIQLEPNQAAS
jgi:hypothetical protein